MFKPTYKVIIPVGKDGKANRSSSLRAVSHYGNLYYIYKVKNSQYSIHYEDGTVSRIYPTLRDCIFAIITR